MLHPRGKVRKRLLGRNDMTVENSGYIGIVSQVKRDS